MFHKLTAFQRYKGLLRDRRAQVPPGERAWPDPAVGLSMRCYGFGPGKASSGDVFLSLTLSYSFVFRQFWGSEAQEEGSFPPGSANVLTTKADGNAGVPQGGKKVVVLYQWERIT